MRVRRGVSIVDRSPRFRNLGAYLHGVDPFRPGQGLGVEISRYAQWLTHRAGRSRLVVAVDMANTPAICMYRAAGFEVWDRRTVLQRVFGAKGDRDEARFDPSRLPRRSLDLLHEPFPVSSRRRQAFNMFYTSPVAFSACSLRPHGQDGEDFPRNLASERRSEKFLRAKVLFSLTAVLAGLQSAHQVTQNLNPDGCCCRRIATFPSHCLPYSAGTGCR